MLDNQNTHNVVRNFVFGILVVAILIVPDLRGGKILVDPFHHGEFFVSATTLKFLDKIDFIPYTIHGASDYLPAILISNFFHADEIYLPTEFLYRLLNILSTCILLLVFFEITRPIKHHRYLFLTTLIIVIPKLVAYKDLFLLISVYFFLLLQTRNCDQSKQIIIQFLLGVTLAFGLFWSFDRGIAGLISFGLGVIYAARKNKSNLITFAVFSISVLITSQLHPMLSISHNLDNILFLIESSSQWSYGWQKFTVVLTLVGLSFHILVFITVFHRNNIKSLNTITPLLITLLVLQLFFIKIGTIRSDLPHILTSLWTPLLTLFYIYNEVKLNFYLRSLAIMLALVTLALSYLTVSIVLIGLAGILALAYLDFSSTHGDKLKRVYQLCLFGLVGTTLYLLASTSSIRVLSTGILNIVTPINNRLASPIGIRWVSSQLSNANVSCIFDLSNNGLINGIVQRPTCTPYSYPIYAGPNQEQDMLEHLKNTKPNALVYSFSGLSYNFDGRSMKVRFPAVDEYILATYPKQKCNEGYCVRYLDERN